LSKSEVRRGTPPGWAGALSYSIVIQAGVSHTISTRMRGRAIAVVFILWRWMGGCGRMGTGWPSEHRAGRVPSAGSADAVLFNERVRTLEEHDFTLVKQKGLIR
jgi:hypothetical protein